MTRCITADQLVYTSCRHAIGGGSGFQVQSHSPGVAAGDLMTIAQRSRYVRPNSRGPAGDINTNDYPVGFRWYALPSGGWAMTRVRYVGADYTGRPGNFFAHSLVLDAANAALADPGALLDWPGWRDRLAPGEDSAPTVAPLPVVQIASAATGLPAELAGRPDPRARLEQIVVALFDAIDRGLKLVVKADADGGNNLWLRAIGAAFPRAAFRAIEASSLEFSLQQAPTFSITVAGSDIDARHGDHGDFIGLDLTEPLRPLGGAPSAPRAAGEAYAAALTAVLFDRPRLAPDFMAHLDAFAGSAIGADLTAAAQLFLHAERIDVGAGPGANIPDLVRVALRKRDPRFATLIGNLVDPLRAQLRDDDSADQLLLAEAAGFAAQNGADTGLVASAADAWFHAWLAALRSQPHTLDDVTRSGSALEAALGGGFANGVVAALLRDDTAQAGAVMEHASIEGAARLLRFALELLGDHGWNDPIGDCEAVNSLIGAAMRARDAKPRLAALLEVVRAPVEMAMLLQLASFTAGGPAVGAQLGDLAEVAAATIDGLPQAMGRDLRRQLPPHLIVAEWGLRLAKGQALECYRRHASEFLSEPVLQMLTPADRSSMLRATTAAAEAGDAQDLPAIVAQLAGDGWFAQLDRQEQERLLDRAAVSIGFDEGEPAKEVPILLREARRLRLEPVLHRAQLSLTLRELDRGRAVGRSELAVIGAAIATLPAGDRALVRSRLTYHALQDLAGEDGGALFARFAGGADDLHFTAEDINRALKRLEDAGDARPVLALLEWWFVSPVATQRFAKPLWDDTFDRLVRTSVAIDRRRDRVIAKRFLADDDEQPNRGHCDQWRVAYRRRAAGPLDQTKALVGGIARLFSRKPRHEG